MIFRFGLVRIFLEGVMEYGLTWIGIVLLDALLVRMFFTKHKSNPVMQKPASIRLLFWYLHTNLITIIALLVYASAHLDTASFLALILGESALKHVLEYLVLVKHMPESS